MEDQESQDEPLAMQRNQLGNIIKKDLEGIHERRNIESKKAEAKTETRLVW